MQHLIIKFLFIFNIVFLFLMFPILTLADCANDEDEIFNDTTGEYVCTKKSSSVVAAVSCDQQYPWCKDKSGNIADLVRNFYNYALAAVGVAALGAIIFGGIKYTVSAGNPSGQTDAISWITGAVWGLVLLLGANLLLRTINPKLVNLEMIKLEGVKLEYQGGGGEFGGKGASGDWNDTSTTPFKSPDYTSRSAKMLKE